MKRFTETTKWGDPWFRKLSPELKLLWQWLLDNCDHAGVIEPDLELASFHIGYSYPIDTLSKFGERVCKLDAVKWFIPKFIPFQYGELSEDCKGHRPVFQSIEKHQIKGYPKGIHTPQDKTGQGQYKVKSKEGVRGEPHQCLSYLNEKTGRNFRETENNLGFISARLDEPGVTLDGVKKMIDRQVSMWKGGEMEQYLRPETLFNKTKFDSYYSAKDLPVKPEAYQRQKQIGWIPDAVVTP